MAEPHRVEEVRSATTPGIRILLVEDEPDNRDMLCELLKMLGYTVSAAGSAEEALGMFVPGRFDVLLSDLNLPGISGVELASRLRALVPGLKVIIASGAGVALDELGNSGYGQLRKPYQFEELQRLLDGVRR